MDAVAKAKRVPKVDGFMLEHKVTIVVANLRLLLLESRFLRDCLD